MCGRYLLDLLDPQCEELLKYYRMLLQTDDAGIPEKRPSEGVLTYAAGSDGRIRAALTRWGFSRSGSKQLLINARSETLLEKPTFSPHFQSHRCVFPMTGFYEWDERKRRHLFSETGGQLLYAAGLYRSSADGDEVESVILTTSPNELVAPIHDRMPLLLSAEEVRIWLTDPQKARQLLTKEDRTALKKELIQAAEQPGKAADDYVQPALFDEGF